MIGITHKPLHLQTDTQSDPEFKCTIFLDSLKYGYTFIYIVYVYYVY